MRNARRGDPCSAHEFLVDALQGCFYDDDECLVEGTFFEERNAKADTYLLFLRASREEDAKFEFDWTIW